MLETHLAQLGVRVLEIKRDGEWVALIV